MGTHHTIDTEDLKIWAERYVNNVPEVTIEKPGIQWIRKFEQGWRQAPRKKTKGTRKSDQPTPATTLSTEGPISKQPVEVHVHNSTPQQASQQALSQWGYQAGYTLPPPTFRYAPPYFPGYSSGQPYGTWAPEQGASQGYFAANSRRMTPATEQIMEDFEACLLYDEVIPDRRKQFKKVVAYLRREMFTLNEFRNMNREDLSEMAGSGIAKAIVQLSHKMVRQFKAQLSQQERQDHIEVKESAEALTMLGQQNGGGISEEYDYHQTPERPLSQHYADPRDDYYFKKRL
ncbi:MAG: hypothetical protein MMC33_008605 [Icmadophila ericetorum]|nr:hypothetical protein [Icmadophila ericetorum]